VLPHEDSIAPKAARFRAAPAALRQHPAGGK